jgi:type IV secretion system coupling TraD/TrwB family protein
MTLHPVPIGSSQDPYHYGKQVEIVPDARRRHLALFGASGSGKSTLLRNMIAEDIAAGHGVTVVDPHGQLVEDVLENHIPRPRTNDVIYFNPKDHERAFALNMLECRRKEQQGLVVSNVISIFKKLWPDAFASGARMEDIFRNSLHALIERPRPVSIVALPKLLTDEAYRSEVLAAVRNPAVLDFFHNTYDRWTNSFREEAISSVLNKVRAFLTDPLLRAVIGQARSSFDFREAMDNRKIILCDLSKGEIGRDNTMLLGSIIIMQEQLAALSRSDIPESERVDHFLFAEEAHNFIGDFESILSENRKFRLFLAVCLQQLESISRETAAAIFTNAGNLISFRVSSTDAERLRDEFTKVFPGAVIQDLADYKAYVRTLTCDDTGCRPAEPEKVATYPHTEKRITRNGGAASSARATSDTRGRAPKWTRRSHSFSSRGSKRNEQCEAILRILRIVPVPRKKNAFRSPTTNRQPSDDAVVSPF